jgi:hypothetical protein
VIGRERKRERGQREGGRERRETLILSVLLASFLF